MIDAVIGPSLLTENLEDTFSGLDSKVLDEVYAGYLDAIFGARLAELESRPKVEGRSPNAAMRLGRREDALKFAILVYDATKRTGKIALGDFVLDIEIKEDEVKHESVLFIHGLDENPIEIRDYKSALLEGRDKSDTSLLVSLPELRQKLGLDGFILDSILAEATPVLSQTRVVETLDLSAFDAPGFESHIAPLLLQELYNLHKRHSQNIKFIVKGKPALVGKFMKLAGERYKAKEPFIFTNEDALPPLFKREDAKHVTVTPAVSPLVERGRYLYVGPLTQEDALDVGSLIKLAVLEAIIDPESALFEKFIRAYETLWRQKIQDRAQFWAVVEGRERDRAILQLYAILPRPVSVQYALRLYELMKKMAEQAA